LPASEPQSPLSAGLTWASRLSTLGVEFSAPPLVGYYLDQKLGTAPLGILLGMVLGFVVGMLHILRFARESSRADRVDRDHRG